jgi:hypothetical protein
VLADGDEAVDGVEKDEGERDQDHGLHRQGAPPATIAPVEVGHRLRQAAEGHGRQDMVDERRPSDGQPR